MNPLVSFCLKSYNQKQYLIEALKGAFAQTYRPLEIVISDDGSTDGSWEYIQQEVADFRRTHPDVAVVINRNEHNLGNLGNWQKCGELAHGELLVKADGDDVSLPERTTRVVEEWMKAGKESVKVIHHDGWKINVRGRVVGRCGRYTAREPLGAAMAMTRDCFVGFGSIAYPRTVDDIVFGLRALMRGGRELTLADKLLYYRVGCGISSAQYMRRESQKRCIKASIAAYDELLHELVCGCAWLSDQEKIQWRDDVECTRVGCARWLDLVAGETLVARFGGWKACGSRGASIWARCYQAVYILPCWLSDLVLLPLNIAKAIRAFLKVRGEKVGRPE